MCVTMCGGYLYCRWGMDLLWWMDFTAWWESTGAAHDEKVFQLAPRLYLRNYLRNLQSIPRTLQRDEFAMCVTVCGGYLYCRWGVDLIWFTEESPGFPDFTEKFSVFSQINLRNYLRNLQSIPRTHQGGEFAMCVTVCGGYLYCRWGMDLLWWMGEISRFFMMRKYRSGAWWEGVSTCASSVPQKLPEKSPEYPEDPPGGWVCYVCHCVWWVSLR